MSSSKFANDAGSAAPFIADKDAAHSVAAEKGEAVTSDVILNGPGAAAILAAGIGSLALGVFAFAGDASPSILHMFNFWAPTGPLSGVTLTAVVVWLGSWLALSRNWARKSVNLSSVNMASFAMLIGGLLLTFPPFMDFLQGK